MKYILIPAAILIVPLFTASQTRTNEQVSFQRITESAGITFRHGSGGATKDYIVESKGGGVALFDYDGDGWLDIYFVNGSTWELLGKDHAPSANVPRNALYRNKRDGTFEDVTARSGTGHPGWGMGAAAADYDNDGDTDLLVTNFGPVVLYENQGDGTFKDVTQKSGIDAPGWSTGAAWGDYDRDGDLDLYIARYIDFKKDEIPRRGSTVFCQYRGLAVQCGPRGLKALPDQLYRNEGNGTFTNVTEKALGPDIPQYFGFTPIWADFNEDGWPDLYVADDGTPNLLYVNRGDGSFEEQGALAGCAYSGDGREQAGMGADVADYDHDGRFDIIVANFSDDYNTLYKNTGGGFFEDVTAAAGIATQSWQYVTFGLKFLDYDLDGWEDFFVANGHVYPEVDTWKMDSGYREPPQVFRNSGDGTFRETSGSLGDSLKEKHVGRGAAFGDLDNDGDTDVVITNLDDAPTVLRCDVPTKSNWLVFCLRGTKSNRDGIGAVIRVRSGEMEQWQLVHQSGSFLASNDIRAVVGLGPNTKAEEVEIRWPSGLMQKISDVPSRSFVKVVEGQANPQFVSKK